MENSEQNTEVQEQEVPIVEEVVENSDTTEEEKDININKEEETIEETDKESEQSDSLKEALRKNEELNAKLAKLEELDNNVYQENEKLEKLLKEREEMAELSKKNAELEARLEAIDRRDMIDAMVASGQLVSGLKDWAEGLTFEQLKAFKANAPKKSNILTIENENISEGSLELEEKLKSIYAMNGRTKLKL